VKNVAMIVLLLALLVLEAYAVSWLQGPETPGWID